MPSEPLSSVDHTWLRMDDPTNLMLINGVLVLEQPVALASLQAIIEKRLLPIPRFRQKVVRPARGRPRWEPAASVDIARQVTEEALPAGGDDAELTRVINGLMSAPLDPERPLWHMHLIHGYRGGSVLMGRIHHAIGDGVALMLVLLSLAELSPDAAANTPELQRNPFTELLSARSPAGVAAARELAERVMPDGMRLLLAPVEAIRQHPLATAAAAVVALGRLILRRRDPRTAFKGPLQVAKRVAWSEPLPLSEVKRLGQALGGTVNDVLLAAMTGGLRRYLEGRGESTAGLNFRAAMPVNLRPLDHMADLGNHFGLVFLSLPVGVADPAGRLAELRRRSLALRRSAEPVVVFAILRVMGLLPPALQRLVVAIFATKTTAVMTNIPGPRETLYLDGKPIGGIFFWVPQSGRVGIGISICSYAGEVRLGVGTDAGLVPDPEAIVAGFHQEFAAMGRLSSAGQGRQGDPVRPIEKRVF